MNNSIFSERHLMVYKNLITSETVYGPLMPESTIDNKTFIFVFKNGALKKMLAENLYAVRHITDTKGYDEETVNNEKSSIEFLQSCLKKYNIG